jgi:hypothetical protein
MTPREREAWKADDSTFDYGESKKTPAEPPTPQADSSPAPAGEQPDQPASMDATPPPASGPGKKTDKQKRDADLRVAELLEEREQLRAKLKAQETAQSAAPPPQPKASKAADFPEFETWTVDHPEQSFYDYLDVRADHRAAQRQAIQQVEQARLGRIKTWTERLDEAKQDPAFVPSLSPEITELIPVDMLPQDQPITPANIIAQEVVNLRNPQLMPYLSAHPEDFRRLQTLETPADIIREMGRLDERVTRGTQTPAAPKFITSAPPPPKLVNQRPAEAADPALAAVNSGDYRAFKAAADAADRARR